MKNKFIPYQQSLELKELGFDEPCMYAWCVTLKHRVEYDGEISLRTDGNPFGVYYKGKNFNEKYDSHKNKIQCSAPLYQQVFKWFREKHSLYHSIDPLGYNMCLGLVGQLGKLKSCNVPNYGTYEEAELECVKELISIVKNKYN
jgi:hypothetical protein